MRYFKDNSEGYEEVRERVKHRTRLQKKIDSDKMNLQELISLISNSSVDLRLCPAPTNWTSLRVSIVS